MSADHDVRSVLVRLGWILRRRPGGIRFEVSRSAGGGALFELAATVKDSSSLAPSVRLRLKRRAGARLTSAEEEGVSALSSALGLFMERATRRGAGDGGDAASSEGHAGKEGRDPLLRITFACNQRCPFCFVPLTGRGADFGDIEKKLDALVRDGDFRGELTISGGEPTLDRRLPSILEAARLRGGKRFILQTNGVYLSRPGLLEKLVGLGVVSFLVSFHAHEPALYDRITGSRGQYPLAVEGLSLLLKRCSKGSDVNATVNVVVNSANYRRLPELVEFLGRLKALCGGRGPELYFSMLNEAGHQDAPSWAVDLRSAAPFLRRAVRLCRKLGMSVTPFGGESGFPPCILDDPGRHTTERALPMERVRYADDFRGESGSFGRAKLPACRRCSFDARCFGVPATYARDFGLEALKPSRRKNKKARTLPRSSSRGSRN